MMYLSATYFAKYHADISEVEETVRGLVKTWPAYPRVYISIGNEQINVNWSQAADPLPENVYAYLGMAVDGALYALRVCAPDMVSAMLRNGDRSYNTYACYHSDKQAELEALATAARDGLVAA